MMTSSSVKSSRTPTGRLLMAAFMARPLPGLAMASARACRSVEGRVSAASARSPGPGAAARRHARAVEAAQFWQARLRATSRTSCGSGSFKGIKFSSAGEAEWASGSRAGRKWMCRSAWPPPAFSRSMNTWGHGESTANGQGRPAAAAQRGASGGAQTPACSPY